MIHPTSDVQSKHVGKNTNVWQFCVVLPEARIGEDCNICSHCFIENDVTLGDRVTVKCGVQIWDGMRVDDDVFIGPNVTFTNDMIPRSRQKPAEFARTWLKKGASVGANATILPGLTIGEGALIGAGSVVTKSIPDFTIAIGSPARETGWICPCGCKIDREIKSMTCDCGRRYKLQNGVLVINKHVNP